MSRSYSAGYFQTNGFWTNMTGIHNSGLLVVEFPFPTTTKTTQGTYIQGRSDRVMTLISGSVLNLLRIPKPDRHSWRRGHDNNALRAEQVCRNRFECGCDATVSGSLTSYFESRARVRTRRPCASQYHIPPDKCSSSSPFLYEGNPKLSQSTQLGQDLVPTIDMLLTVVLRYCMSYLTAVWYSRRL